MTDSRSITMKHAVDSITYVRKAENAVFFKKYAGTGLEVPRFNTIIQKETVAGSDDSCFP